ncbi:hypothetical protein A1O7_07164 [Cladophialophora yegresii CBS 114405]|uniref:Uncharacterized protein n=1 Tax=Cladophialophora yegresii CBS 114405 TaxID=1182544 RepID=W9VUU8_9EURO|nr:uncharacterized protein A1O7_07164 [Cladophialophora yegresii CBS 114405]EXJ56820.1 hypothetical protein A1O7_07164 [Cladophialophora yegresii CBS 114405]
MTNSHKKTQETPTAREGRQRPLAGMVESAHIYCRILLLTKVSLAIENETPSETSASSDPVSYEAILLQKHALLAEEAVTYQVKKITPSKKGSTSSEEPCEPVAEHYSDNEKHDFRVGEIYRIWHPLNVNVHLGTFLVMDIEGTEMVCLKLKHCHPNDVDRTFDETHVKLKALPHVPGSYVHRRASSRLRAKQQEEEQEAGSDYVVYMENQQCLKEDSYINLRRSWDINWQDDYQFVYCGRLEEKSFYSVLDIHVDRYSNNLRRHVVRWGDAG